jgi:fatty acyl-CoA reductase
MVGALDEGKITEYFRNKSVLITGSTGFLGKSMIIHTLVFCRTNLTPALCAHPSVLAVLVEKILRVQPDVRRIYLPVRAADAAAAKQRVETEVRICLSMIVQSSSSALPQMSLLSP